MWYTSRYMYMYIVAGTNDWPAIYTCVLKCDVLLMHCRWSVPSLKLVKCVRVLPLTVSPPEWVGQ